MLMPNDKGIGRILSLDVSKKTYKSCVLTAERNFQDRKLFSGEMSREGRSSFISSLKEGDLVVLEGGTSSFNFAREVKENSKAEVVVLNPAKLHIIFQSQCKTDRQDAVKIAYYIRDTNRENWAAIEVPTKEESDMRSVINAYDAAKKERTRGINRLHAIFNQAGHPTLKRNDLVTNSGRIDRIASLLDGVSFDLAMIEEEFITNAENKIERYEQMMRSSLEEHPKETVTWMSIPGISFKTAAALIAYVGDGKRFSNAQQLRNYIGLVPRIDQSGDRCTVGKISSYGCRPVRRNIIQGAWSIRNLSYECPLKSHLDSLSSKGKKKQKVQVAVANKMITIGWTLLKKGELYSPTPVNVLRRKLKEAKIEAIDCSFFPELC